MVRTITPTMTDAAPIAKGDQQDTWIESPLYDSMFFIAAPILGALYLFASLRAPHLRIIPGVFFTVGMAHYLSTFSFYFGDDNRANYRSNILAFFLGPAALLVAAGIMRLSPLLPLLLTIIYLWNVWHISLQSCGILSVYRHLSSAPHDEKKYANGLILSVSAALVAANINGFEPLRQLLVRVSPQVPILIFYASLVALMVWRMAIRASDDPSVGWLYLFALLVVSLVMVLLLLLFEHAKNTIDRLSGINRVQRAQNKVTGFRRAQRNLHGVAIAHFADENYLWRLTQRGAQAV